MNVVISTSQWRQRDLDLLFGDEEVHFSEQDQLPALLSDLEIYPSRTAARKVGREGDVPKGWTDNYKASKKTRLWIWNPTE